MTADRDGLSDAEDRAAHGSGRRTRPHTADMTVEAWAPTREDCIAQAVLGLVEGFADISGAPTLAERDVTIGPGSPEDQLVAVLDEVIYRLDTAGEVPIKVSVAGDRAGLRVRFETAAVSDVLQIGAIPKAVALHGLVFQESENGWRCSVTIDV